MKLADENAKIDFFAEHFSIFSCRFHFLYTKIHRSHPTVLLHFLALLGEICLNKIEKRKVLRRSLIFERLKKTKKATKMSRTLFS